MFLVEFNIQIIQISVFLCKILIHFSLSGFETLNNEDKTSFFLDTNDHHGYHGLINEDETNVVVTPTIKVQLSTL